MIIINYTLYKLSIPNKLNKKYCVYYSNVKFALYNNNLAPRVSIIWTIIFLGWLYSYLPGRKFLLNKNRKKF